ncbi:rCG24452 [Rattus norvegicus]|uniref:RCG24452 n=1 Tax=Rattus norvegicus TaxID=10116 RepID=A6KJC4_RAT|nr:rCG24452 [Rattus norvegicus]
MAAPLSPPRSFLCGLFSQALQWKGAAQVLRDVYVGKDPVFRHVAEHNAVCPHFLHR